MILREALKEAEKTLLDAGVPSPAVDARLIAAHLLGTAPLSLDRLGPVPEGFDELIARRAQREPLQHIVETAPFGHLNLHVGPGVFIPRPETELLADWAVREAGGRERPTVVDLCTGSGAIAQYVASLVPDADVIGVELHESALGYARRNAPDARIIQGDVTVDPLPELRGRVDIVVSNPPYVPLADDLEPEVYADPPEAVFAGKTGMDVIEAMAPVVRELLKPGGVVGIEHDDTTSPDVVAILERTGLSSVEAHDDMAGRPRFVTACKM